MPCKSEWQHNSGYPIETCFIFKHNPEAEYLRSLKIQCLKCNAKYERLSQKS